jgi:glycine dehydrogenase subunit 1
MKNMSDSCGDIQSFPCFLGAGAYKHFIPSAVEQLISRGEFYTSYTPYQAEMSQGMLQSIFEFQSMICELTKMDVANASLYDGASAMAEAVNLAVKHNENKCVLVSKAVHPEYRQVLRTYANAFDVKIIEVETENGLSDIQDMESKIKDDMACIIVQSPNFLGCIEDLGEISDLAHKNDLLLIAGITEPVSLGLLKPPGELGADIVVGEAQAFGNPLFYGGPHLGFAAAKLEFLKKMPGRISGLSVDAKNESGYILTLQAREQHVRRERATSNICTNQALNALAATIYLALAGKNGLKKVAEICAHRAHYASKRISEIEGFSPKFSAPFFNEFAVNCPSSAKDINSILLKKKILGGFELGRFYSELENSMMFCVTEMNPKEDIDRLVAALGEVVP